MFNLAWAFICYFPLSNTKLLKNIPLKNLSDILCKLLSCDLICIDKFVLQISSSEACVVNTWQRSRSKVAKNKVQFAWQLCLHFSCLRDLRSPCHDWKSYVAVNSWACNLQSPNCIRFKIVVKPNRTCVKSACSGGGEKVVFYDILVLRKMWRLVSWDMSLLWSFQHEKDWRKNVWKTRANVLRRWRWPSLNKALMNYNLVVNVLVKLQT